MMPGLVAAQPWSWEPGTEVNLGVLLIDRVGSTRESLAVSEEEFRRRQTQYYAGVEDIARAYGAYDRLNWQGDGLMLVFWEEEPAALASKVATVGMELWQRIHVQLGMQARSAGHLAFGVQWNPNPGQLAHREINLCGHLEKDAPSGTFVVSEDVYWQLTDGIRDSFGGLGLSRDSVPSYGYPKGRGSEQVQHSKEHDLWEKIRRYCLGPEIASIRCVGFPLRGQAPRSLQVEEIFVRPNLDPTVPVHAAAVEGERRFYAGPSVWALGSENALKESLGCRRSLVVLGEPGSGKTTLLRWLAIAAAKGRFFFRAQTGLDERRLPLPISVGRLAEVRASLGIGGSVPHALARYFHDRSIGPAEDIEAFLEKMLAEGRCLLLFDGLDEVASNQTEIIGWLEAFAGLHPDNRYVASSRLLGYGELRLPDFHEVRLTPFSDEQVEGFLTGFYRACHRQLAIEQSSDRVEQIVQSKTGRLLAEIRADARLASVARNPFLLLMLALVHETEGKLPRHRVQFYQVVARTLCETWADARRLVRGPDRTTVHFEEEALPILGSLALRMHDRHPDGVAPRQAVVDMMAEALVEQRALPRDQAGAAAEEFLRRAGQQAGLLSERGVGLWGFLHLTFQEYFAAVGLHAKEEFEARALENMFEPRWEEIVRLGVGSMALVQVRLKAAASFVRKAAEQQAPPDVPWISEILRKQVPLAALLAAEVAESMDSASKVEIFGSFLDWVCQVPNAVSARYLREIGALASEAIAPLVGEMLGHEQSAKRQKAAFAAGLLRDVALAAPLSARLDDQAADVRGEAAMALSCLSFGAAFDKLVDRLERDPDYWVRAACAYALGEMGDERAVPALRGALNDDDQLVVESAVNALRIIAPTEILGGPGEKEARSAPPVEAALLLDWPAVVTVTQVERLLEDERPGVRRTTMDAVRHSGRSEFLPLIARALSDPDLPVRSRAILALSSQMAKDAKPLLEAATRDTSDWVAAEAIGELAKLDSARAEALLTERGGSGQPMSKWMTRAKNDILVRRHAFKAIPMLVAAIRDPALSEISEDLFQHLWFFADLGPKALQQNSGAD
jgi:HEAT repeat protein